MNEKLSTIKAQTVYANKYDVDRREYKTAVKDAEFSGVERFSALAGSIVGQDHAVQAIKESLYASGKSSGKRGVKDIIVMAGAPGTGKSALCDIIAKASSVPSKVINLAAYNDKEASLFDLFGINGSYKMAKNGLVTEFAYINPFSVIVFDEAEKAHPNVLRALMGMLEEGVVHDACMGIDVDFSNVTTVFVTNVGRDIYNRNAGVYNFANVAKSEILEALRTEVNPVLSIPYFNDALVSRFSKGKVIMFNKLRPEVLLRICAKKAEDCRVEYEKRYGLEITVDERKMAELMVFSQDGSADARSMIGEIEAFFAKNVTRAVQLSREKGVRALSKITLSVDMESASTAAKSYYVDENTKRVLFYGGEEAEKTLRKAESDGIEVCSATSSDGIMDMDLSAAIIDVDGLDCEVAKQIFRAAISLETVPVYVYSENDRLKSDFLYYTDHGAVEVNSPAIGKQTSEWLDEIVDGLSVSHVKQGLLKSNKVFVYGDVKIEVDEKTESATVVVTGIDVETVRKAGDNRVLSDREIPSVTFDDVIGADSVKKHLQRAVKYLKNPRKYAREGNRIPRGIILQGEPGTGKTMLARAVAGAAGVPFISVTGAEFHNKWQGEGARMIRETFAEARRYAPSIVFIDEIDAIGKSRMNDGGGTNVDDQINTLLTEMDGFSVTKNSPVLVIAATNFDLTRGETVLDPALLRRFDVKVNVPLPEMEHRKEFLTRILGKKQESDVTEETISLLAKRSAGWNLAELELVVENAVRSLDDGERLTGDSLMEEYERYVSGDSRKRSEDAVRRTAIHESGHAVVASLLNEPPTYVTVTSRGSFGGYVEMSNEGRDSFSKSELLNRICIGMAGRASECVYYGADGERTGASADIKNATKIALSMICDYGMDPDMMFCVSLENPMSEPWIREKVSAIIKEQYERAYRLVSGNKRIIDAVTDRLMEKSCLDGAELTEIVKTTEKLQEE